MVKLEALISFTLNDFDKLKNVEYKTNGNREHNGLLPGDTFECDETLAKYLTGENDKNIVASKILEIIPEVVKEEKPKKKKASK